MDPSRSIPNVYNLGFKAGSLVAELLYMRRRLTLSEVADVLTSFPVLYKEWWLNLVANDPIHVLVETTLIIAIVYFLVSRSKDWKASDEKEKLTAKEENELLYDWKQNIRAPLAPKVQHQPEYAVIHKTDGRTITLQVNVSSSMSASSVSTDSTPVTNNVSTEDAFKGGATRASENTHPAPEFKTVLNFGTSDYLGRSASNSLIKEAALKALDKYGCGSCGPRGFYGTVDVHLELESAMAKFIGTDDAILYSDGASTVSSTVAAFAKRGDLIVADEGIYEPLMTGVSLSRANVKWFKHNDMADLQKVLAQVQESDIKLGRKLNDQRRFLVVEGLYKNTGKVVPLDDLIKLKEKYCFRLILDESNSFGVLGKTGRGVTELFGKQLMRDVEITTISLENAVGSIGGVTVGSEEVVDHQRLSGSGYCFSASSPPFTATAAIKSIELLAEQPETLKQLRENQLYLRSKLLNLCQHKLEEVLVITSDERSPMVILQVADIPETKNLDEIAFLSEVVKESLNRGVAFVATGHQSVGLVRTAPPPAIRICVSCLHTKEDIDHAVTALGESVDFVLNRMHDS
ncbi:serine palmitoyltransferase [Fistulifera solaris]|uniref:serine C-palmitoyltransferase n=1 Tax=Fistulifera solaris TaxID=1519565 RepID=A0A1Z5JIT6_FISSO|nr:serine palmitoyltransferase [Fistulifera solaris]|eukprot:GAX13909.1 serine palmitoyltransferase [Fistulifera solaris]